MVDVIIPTYRPGPELFEILDILGRQTLKPGKIIIINTGERYIKDMLSEHTDLPDTLSVYNVDEDSFDHGGTRAMATGYSEADIFVFMTQDAMPADERFIEELIKPLSQADTAASYARQLPKAGCSVEESYTRAFNYPDESVIKSKEDIGRLGIKTFFCSNVSCAYRRDIYDKLGGFVKKTIFNEDMIYAATAIKAGYKIAYSAEARVYHSHDYSAMEQFKRNVDIGISQAEHPEVFDGLSSESEGKRLVCRTIGELCRTGHLLRIPGYMIKIAFRYAGFLTGKNYRKLPLSLIKKVSSNPVYFMEEERCVE